MAIPANPTTASAAPVTAQRSLDPLSRRATHTAAKKRKPTAHNRTDPRCRNVRASGTDVVKSDTRRSGANASSASSHGGTVDNHQKCSPRSPIATVATASRLRRTAAKSITVAAHTANAGSASTVRNTINEAGSTTSPNGHSKERAATP